jgi:hypothetical protein
VLKNAEEEALNAGTDTHVSKIHKPNELASSTKIIFDVERNKDYGQARFKEYEDTIRSLKVNFEEQKKKNDIDVAQLKESLAEIQLEANMTQKRLREEIENKNNDLQSIRAYLNKLAEKQQIEEFKKTREELKSQNIKDSSRKLQTRFYQTQATINIENEKWPDYTSFEIKLCH